jgi:hypothetical protein
MKQIKLTLSGASGESLGSFLVSEQFVGEAKRLKINPVLLVKSLCDEWMICPPDSIAVPRGYGLN